MRCSNCDRPMPPNWFQLSAEGRLICGDCYLENPPQEDIEGILYEIEQRLARESGGCNGLR